jgi:F-type H+-transporting ATPase subunit d
MNKVLQKLSVRPETLTKIKSLQSRQLQLLKLKSDLTAELEVLNGNALVKGKIDQFKPQKLDMSEQLSIIRKEKQVAVKEALKTQEYVTKEINELKVLLGDIEQARPIDQLTVDDVAKAYPPLDSIVEKMAKRGQWKVPGYYEKFGEFSVGF